MKQMSQRFLLCTLLGCFIVFFANAQKRTISGILKDEKGDPIANASFVVKGTHNGGVTDQFGAFTVTLTGEKAVLIISSVGYKNKEVEIGSGSTLSIFLEP